MRSLETLPLAPARAPRDARAAGIPLRGPRLWPWIPACAGMSDVTVRAEQTTRAVLMYRFAMVDCGSSLGIMETAILSAGSKGHAAKFCLGLIAGKRVSGVWFKG